MKRMPIGWQILSVLCCVMLLLFPIPVHASDMVTPCPPEPTNMNISYGVLVSCGIDSAGDTDLYHFSGNSGDVALLQVAYQSGSIRPCLELIAPDASSLIACANAFANRIDTTLNQTGTYTIVVDVLISGSTGDYALALERLITPSPNATAVQYGNLYESTIDLPGDLDLFTFEGEAGTTIRILGTFVDGTLRPCIELVAPNNSRITACGNSFSNSIDTMLTQNGVYVVLYTNMLQTSTGDYALALERLIPPSSNANPLPYGVIQPGELNPTGDIDLFEFEGRSGTTIRLKVTYVSGSLRPCEELISPDNTRTAACENAFTNTITASLNQTGTYAVLVTNLIATSTGGYNLELQCLVGICEDTYPLYLPLMQK
jgi:hypothetical protein